MKTHPFIAALPNDDKTLKEMSKIAPKSQKFRYIMMDSGASLNAADIDVHFPEYKQLLRESEGQRKGEFAYTANGQKLFNKGEFDVHGECNDTPLSLCFTNVKVDAPIASVRRFVQAGCKVIFEHGGGHIVDEKSGARINFLEIGRVYFLKYKIKQPTSHNKPPAFGRQAP